MSENFAKRESKEWIAWNGVTAYSFEEPPSITNELPSTRMSVLNYLITPALCSSPHNRMRHISNKNVSENILQCVCRLRIVSNASQTNWQILPTPKRPRIIQPVFLSKYWLLIAIDTLFRRKRDWVPREWFVSPNLPETHFKVKSHHSIFQSTSFNRGLRRMRSTTNVFPEPHKISIKLFHSEKAQNPTGLVL